jgi:hypothetical protein
MAMNLVEQQKVLRDLTDDMLQQAMQGGMAPPYMVLAEINRRKDARERYTAQKAKYDANQATVAQDIMQQMAQATQAAQAPAPTMGGLDSAMGAPMGVEPPVSGGLDAAAPAFADGGMVQKFQSGGMSLANPSIIQSLMGGSSAPAPMSTGNPATMAGLLSSVKNDVNPFQFAYPEYKNPYGSLVDLYTSQIEGLNKERENARAMALIAAGTGMMQGGQNTLKNIGAAFGPAMAGYQTQIGSINQAERDMLSGKVNAQIAGTEAEKAARREFEDSPQGRAQLAKSLGYEPGTTEYEQLVVNGTIPTSSGGSFTSVPGRDKAGQLITAQYNRRTGKYTDSAGNELPGFTELSDAELAQLKKTAMGMPTEQQFRGELGAMDVNIDNAQFQKGSVQKAIDFVSNPNNKVGGLADLLSGIGGTDANRLKSLVSTVKANTAFGQLDELRRLAAATGAVGSGLGQVTQNEMRLLEDAVATVETSNKREDIYNALLTVRDKYDSIIEKIKRMTALVYQDYMGKVEPGSFEEQIIQRHGLDNLDFSKSITDAASGPAAGSDIPDPLGMR